MPDMTTRLGTVTLPNPVLTASGCAAAGRELHQFFDIAELGAVVTKSIMRSPRSGRATPRMAETPSGMLNSIGLQGPGIDSFIEHDLAWLAEHGARTVVSIAGGHTDEFVELARRLYGNPAVSMLEVNISCPNVESRGQVFACDPLASSRVIGAVRRAADPAQPVFAKLSPDVTDITHIARACADAGADGFSLINTLLGMVIDTETLAPALGGITGGLSGPAIRPVAVRCVYQVRAALPHLPILGMGGIRSGLDALQFVLAGASAVSVGTAVFGDPSAPVRILAELEQALPNAASPRCATPSGSRTSRRPSASAGCSPGRPRRRPGDHLRGPPAHRTGRPRLGLRGHRPAHHPAGRVGAARRRDGLARFADICVRAFAGVVAAVKPQSAFFEVHGAAGVAVLEQTIAACGQAGALVVLDVKRGDIGSTMAAYARAYLDPTSPLAADAITVSPFLGVGSLDPAFATATAHDRGLFVLAATSNPEGPQVQHATTTAGPTVAQTVVDEVAARNAGASPLGSFGVVAGATIGADVARFDTLNGPILAPGVGAQGGTADDVRRIFGTSLRNVLPSVSREVLRAGPDVAALRAAAERLVDEYAFLRA